MGVVNTSVTVSFASASSAEGTSIFSAEVDTRDDGFNNGKSSFYKGDSPVILLYSSPNILLTKIQQSEGTYTDLGFGTTLIEESLTFTNSREEDLDKPYHSAFEIVGAMPALPIWTLADNKILLPANTVAVANIKYVAVFRAYRITNVSGNYPVVVYFEGKTL